MNPAQLLSHFDRISDVPDAITRLRRFILDLAVRGRLVEQDPRDEPASELLKRIQVQKTRLVQAGTIKKGKPLPDIEEGEIPFGIPASWRWVRLNDITSYIQRGKSPKYAAGVGVPVISQKCVQWGGLELESSKLITCESIEEYEPIRFLQGGDLLWNSTGTGTIGRIIKVKEPPPKLVCDSHVTVVRCLEVDAEYVRSWLRSDHVYAVIEDRAAGSTNQVELTSQLAMNQVVPLPPLAEQHRIVAKVDELMALYDGLEASQVERESRRDRLVVSSLNCLNNGADPDAFCDHARFYFNHLPRLTTKREHIQQLRQTILNLAVRGKIVHQDPNDEPASELLKRIQAEKARLLKEGTLARQKLASSEPKELAYDCPMNWQALNFNDVCNLVTSGSRGWAEFYSESGPKFIRAQNIRFGRLRLEDLACVSLPKKAEGTRTQVSKGDLLIVIVVSLELWKSLPPHQLVGAPVRPPWGMVDLCMYHAYDRSISFKEGLMRTTLDLDEKLIRQLMNVTAAKTKTDAIHQAAAELIRRKKLDQLKSLSGTIHLDLDWKRLEGVELQHQSSLKRRRHGHR